MAVDAGLLFDAGSGVLLVGLALFVATRRPTRSTNLLFAGFGGLWGLVKAVLNGIRAFGGDPGPLFILGNGALALAGVLLLALVSRFPAIGRPRPGPPMAIGALSAVVLVLVESSWTTVDLSPRTSEDVGNLVLVGAMVGALIVLVARYALAEATSHAPQRAGVRLVSAALVMDPALRLGLVLMFAFPTGLVGLSALAAAGITWLVQTGRASNRDEARATRNLALLFLSLPLVGMLMEVATPNSDLFDSGVLGLARTLSVAILGYAILKRQLLGVDVRVKWTIKQSTVAAVFIAVFFVVSEGAAALFQSTTGSTWAGILAAGALVFALAPLQRFAEGVSEKAMPGVRPIREMSDDERLAVYRQQLEIAYADGAVDASERRLLQGAREQLGIPHDAAERLELDVLTGLQDAEATGPPGGPS